VSSFKSNKSKKQEVTAGERRSKNKKAIIAKDAKNSKEKQSATGGQENACFYFLSTLRVSFALKLWS